VLLTTGVHGDGIDEPRLVKLGRVSDDSYQGSNRIL